MTAIQKHQAFLAVCAQVREIERCHKQQRILDQARADFSLYYAELVKQRDQARKDGSFSLLK